MGKDVMEHRVHMRRSSFILTIPQAIVKKAGISSGQSVRFEVRDGEIVIRPLSVGAGDHTADPDGPDKYARAVEEMIAKGRSEKPGGRGTTSSKSKLERLRLR